MATSIYRPPQWAAGPPMVSITVPASTSNVSATAGTSAETVPGTPLSNATLEVGSVSTAQASAMTYVFDAVLDLEHEQRLEKTHHPVQNGADISSHAYLMPARLVMYVLMSDAVGQYSSGAVSYSATGSPQVSPWTGNPSKSVSAYQTVLALQAARKPLTIVTRLRTYMNMLIVSPAPREDYKTITGLRMRLEFEQIFTASTAQVPNSARSNDTATTGLGTVAPTPVAAQSGAAAASTTNVGSTLSGAGATTTVNQFQYPPQTAASPYSLPANDAFTDYLIVPSTVNIAGAGAFSSVPGQQALP